MMRKDPYLVVYCGYDNSVKSFLSGENIPLQTQVLFPDDISQFYTILSLKKIDLLLADDIFSEVWIHQIVTTLVSRGYFIPYAVIDTGRFAESIRPLAASPLAILHVGEYLTNRLEMLIYNMFGQAELKLQLEFLISAWNQSKDNFLFLSEHIPYAVWTRDPGTLNYNYINKVGEKIIGIPFDTLLSRSTEYPLNLPSWSLIKSFIQDDLRRISAGDDSPVIRYYETVASANDGNSIAFANVSAMVKDNDGKWLYLGVSKSMIKQVSADCMISEVSERFYQTLEAAPVPILVFKFSGMMYANSAAVEMLEAEKAEDLYSHLLKDFVRSDYHETSTNRLFDLMNKKTVPVLEQVWVTLSGKEITVEVRSTRVELFSEDVFIIFVLDITARKKAENEILDKNRYISELYRLAPYALGVTKDGKLTEANERFFEMTGYSPVELLGETLEKIHINSTEYLQMKDTRQQLLAEGNLTEIESHYKAKDGSIIDVIIRRTAAPSLGDDAIIFCAIDITGIKETERQLLKKNSLIRDLYRLSPIGLGVMNTEFLIEGNEALYNMFEYPPEELLGNTLQKIHYPEKDYFDFRDKILSQISNTGFAEEETRYITKSGSIRDIIIRLLHTPSLGNDMAIFSVIDVTRLRNAERELLSLYEDAPVSMILLDNDFNVRRANRAAIEFSGSQSIRKLNVHICNFLKCSALAQNQTKTGCLECELNSILQEIKIAEKSILDSDIDVKLRDGNFLINKTLSVSLSKITVLGEQLILFCFNDVSEKRMFETRFNQIQQLELTGLIASGAAHDFNNILAAISLHLSSLIDNDLSAEKLCHELSMMNEYVDRGSELTKRLLSMGRNNYSSEQTFSIKELMQNLQIMIQKISG
ncbi:MAG: PAS domain S-box protein, partial [Spirochaetes bacterium]|nr:PAS domain S-box protein [Spirochaetota bacterium]